MISLANELVRPIENFANGLELITDNSMNEFKIGSAERSSYRELDGAIKQVKTLTHQVRLLEREQAENSKSMAVAKLAKQVAHDIRSPLSALNILIADAAEWSDDKRNFGQLITKRISEIADGLLAKSRAQERETCPYSDISVLLDEVLREKLIQFSNKSSLCIKSEINLTGCFVLGLSPNDFKTSLSNIINNAAESMNFDGTILVSIRNSEQDYLIEIRDDGTGMSERTLALIGEDGATFGKPEGNGLGVSHAKRTVTRVGGQMTIESSLGRGTKVRLRLPISRAVSV